MTYEKALAIVIDAAEDWAGEYGFTMPKAATAVFEAVAILTGKESK